MDALFVRIVIGLLGASGLLISSFFALVNHSLLAPDSRVIPKVCRMEKSSCVSILDSKDARLLGVQNFYPGMVYYALVLLWATCGTGISQFLLLLKIASTVTVIVGIYLTISLIFKLKTPCLLCFAGHSINLFLFLAFLSLE